MNLIQGLMRLRAAIDQLDWHGVAGAYEMLTGEQVEVPNAPETEKSCDKSGISDIINPPPKKPRGRPKKKVADSPAIERAMVDTPILIGKEKKPNKFVDTGELHSEDKLTAEERRKFRPSERRPPARMIKLKCQNCTREYEMNADFILPDARKLCNSCSRMGR